MVQSGRSISREIKLQEAKTDREDSKDPKNSFSYTVEGLEGRVYLLLFKGDFPYRAFELNLNKKSDRWYLQWWLAVINSGEQGLNICEFRDRRAYLQGRRMVGQHYQIRRKAWFGRRDPSKGIQIGKFQSLVKAFGYRRAPLSADDRKVIRDQYRIQQLTVSKLAYDWDVSESQILRIVKPHNPAARCKKPTESKRFSASQPRLPGRVAKKRQGYRYE